jgi:uncharacterized protein YqgQ
MSYGGEERIGLRISVDSTETKAAEKRVAELHRELDALGKQYQSGSLSSGQYLKATAALNRELEQIEKRLATTGGAAKIAQRDMDALRGTVHTTSDGLGRSGMMVYQFGQAISDMSYGLAYGLNNISMIAAMMGVGGAFGIGIQFGIAGLEVLSRNWGNLTRAIDASSDSIAVNVDKLRNQEKQLTTNAKLAQELVKIQDADAKRAEKAKSFPGEGETSDLDRLKKTVQTIGSKQAVGEIAKMRVAANLSKDEETARQTAEQIVGALMGDNAAAAMRAAEQVSMMGGMPGKGGAPQFMSPIGDLFGRTQLGSALRFGLPADRDRKKKEVEAKAKLAESTLGLDYDEGVSIGGAASLGRALPAGIRRGGDAIRERQRKQEEENDIETRNESNAAIAKAKEEEKQKRRAIAEAAAAGNREAAQAALQANPGIADDVMGVMGAVGVSPRAQAVIRKRIALLLKANGSTAQGADLDAMVSEILTQMLMVARAQGAQSQENAIIRHKLSQLDAMNRMIAEEQRRSAQTLQRMGR